MLAAFFRLAQAATLGVNLLNLFFGLQLIGGAEYLTVFSADQQHALALLFFNAHSIGYTIGMVFFGLSMLILGYLVFKSGYFPKILGGLLIFAAFGYLIDSFAKFLLPNYASYETLFTMIVFIPAFVAELSFGVWLLVKGIRVRTPENHTPETA